MYMFCIIYFSQSTSIMCGNRSYQHLQVSTVMKLYSWMENHIILMLLFLLLDIEVQQTVGSR